MKKHLHFNFVVVLLTVLPLFSKSQTWQEVDGGVGPYSGSRVYALHVFENKLFAGGHFNEAGSTPANSLASWDGQNWDTINQSLQGGIFLVNSFGGELYVGGDIGLQGIPNWDMLYKYSPTSGTWSSAGAFNQMPLTAEIFNNDFFVGGYFSEIDGQPRYAIAKLTSSGWSNVAGNDFQNGFINSLKTFNGELYSAGLFNSAGAIPANNIAKWDGSNWSTVGDGLDGNVTALEVYNGKLYAGGSFNQSGSKYIYNLAVWTGTEWDTVSSGTNGPVHCLKAFDDKLFIGGSFSMAGGDSASNVAMYFEDRISPVGKGMDAEVKCFEVHNSRLYAGGDFEQADGLPAKRIAVYAEAVLPSVKPETANAFKAMVFPNPFRYSFTMEVPEEFLLGNVEVFDFSGKVVYQGLLNNIRIKINAEPFETGFYLIKATSLEGKVITEKAFAR